MNVSAAALAESTRAAVTLIMSNMSLAKYMTDSQRLVESQFKTVNKEMPR
jgi:hypothetical protein